MLSARGSISQHASTGQIFVRDTAAVIEAIREVIHAIDVPPKQVMIEARVVEVLLALPRRFGSTIEPGEDRFSRGRCGTHGSPPAWWPPDSTVASAGGGITLEQAGDRVAMIAPRTSSILDT